MKIYSAILFISAGLLFLATLSALSLPYGYFTFFRIMVCATAVYTAFRMTDSIVALLGLLMIAILFNPILLIHLPQPTWRIIDLAVAATFIRLAIKLLKTQEQQ